MRNLINDTRIDFMGRGKLAIIVSSALVLLALLAILIRGLNFGVDFTGGYTIEVGYQTAPDLNEIRQTLAATNLPDSQVQTFGASTEVLIRMAPQEGSSDAKLTLSGRKWVKSYAKKAGWPYSARCLASSSTSGFDSRRNSRLALSWR